MSYIFKLNDISVIQSNLSQQHALLPNLVKSGLPSVIADPDHDNRFVLQDAFLFSGLRKDVSYSMSLFDWVK